MKIKELKNKLKDFDSNFPNEGSGEILYEEDFDDSYYQNQGFEKEDGIKVVYFLFGP